VCAIMLTALIDPTSKRFVVESVISGHTLI